MNKNHRLMSAIGEINEKYVKESEGKTMRAPIIRIAVCLCIVLALGLYLFLPFAPVTSDLTAYSGSDYFPLIEGIEDYRLGFLQPRYKNNFESLMAILDSFKLMAPGMNGGASGGDVDFSPEGSGPNGSYVESTDNQVEGVIESDLMKMTDKYIFRLGYRNKSVLQENKGQMEEWIVAEPVLRIYTIDKENSSLAAEFALPVFDNEYFKDYNSGEMFLSLDGNTITILKDYTDKDTNMSKVGVISLDVSDIQNIKVKAMVSIDGSLNTSRMVDGKLLLVSEFFFNRNNLDYNDPTSFVPTIDSGEGAVPIQFEDIIFPDTVGNTRYSVVTLLDSENLSLLGANALLNFTNEVYVSENNLYITREYVEESEEENLIITRTMTDVAVLNYSGESLEKKGIITVRGLAEDQYSFDEKDGYLRLVTTTLENEYHNGLTNSSVSVKENVSLWIYDLTDNSLAYSLPDFAIEGEEATAVRFSGDMVYVCTAVIVNFTDPVYFIDLSDYESIESADTGIIEGYSDHLIDLGEGFLLGIGRENWNESKVEIYEQQGNAVVSVDEFRFDGNYSLNYKAYLVNREHNLFGFGVDGFYMENEQDNGYLRYGYAYVLLHFNGYELTAEIFDIPGTGSGAVRAAYIDGYLYITTPKELIVKPVG